MSTKWTAQRKAKFRATMKAKREQAQTGKKTQRSVHINAGNTETITALRAEITRLSNELQDALDRNRELQELSGSEIEDIARMAVALVRARAAEGDDK